MHRPSSIPARKKSGRMNLITIVMLCVVTGVVVNIQKGQLENKQSQALAPLYQAVMMQDFTQAKFEDQTLYATDEKLYEKQQELPLTIPYDPIFDDILSLYKTGDNVFFVMGSEGKDYWGIVFSDSHTVVSGTLKTIRQLTKPDTAYYFSTKK